MAVSRRLRFEIFRRDAHTCRYCGATAPDVKLTIDHVTPVALGGTDEPGNLFTACADCNGGKTSIAPDAARVAEVSADAIRWSDALKQAAAEREAEYADNRATEDRFRAIWEEWTAGGRPLELPSGFGLSVRQFLAAGLTFSDLEALVDVAMNTRTVRGAERVWKYFCGCCWKRIEQAQVRAREIAGGQVSEFHVRGRHAEPEGVTRQIASGNEWSREQVLDILQLASKLGGIKVDDASITQWHAAANGGRWMDSDEMPAVELVRYIIERRCADDSGEKVPLSPEAITEMFANHRVLAGLESKFNHYATNDLPVTHDVIDLILRVILWEVLPADYSHDNQLATNLTTAIREAGLTFAGAFHFTYTFLRGQLDAYTPELLPEFARHYLEYIEQTPAGSA
ncbi:HNH endonuclease [Nocardia flavorosea]|uniref:HNH endonuclease n=1 Tax=Nocardia flavorosea TaxID=53429 RepID=A0A846YPU9_9NOCA|nr:HNH endonuclease [Nocardia flavorosea]NKY60793.1 HNH endonuclease [Nocardia flavorosea]